MAKNPNSGTTQAGSLTPLQPILRADGSMVDPRTAPVNGNVVGPDQGTEAC